MTPEVRKEVRFKALERLPELTRQAREIMLDILALVWPTTCVGCGVADREICDICRAVLRSEPQVLTRDIGIRCWAAGTYEGVVRRALIALKHGGQLGYARDLGSRLRAPLLAAVAGAREEENPVEQEEPRPSVGDPREGARPQHQSQSQSQSQSQTEPWPSGTWPKRAPLIVAAPSRRARVRERGYRHVELLVRHALAGRRHTGQYTGQQLVQVRALRALSGRRAQNGLDAAARERNARRVAVISSQSKKIRGREVILVDDVVTTGATLRAAAEALELAGAHVIAAVVLCAVPRRDEVPL